MLSLPMKPEILVDIQMNRYGSFDFDKSEKLIAIGRKKTREAIELMKNVI
jgi:NTE family protein